ncbi:VacJ family lipoprotein [Allohahella marinimesophila]|uniref:Phospholipid-binding lipoprotein MlaA n=1 Tax=Allohahella marinimesophila TaxID=1054972 RepID=A0ABP7PEH2_9GAMM
MRTDMEGLFSLTGRSLLTPWLLLLLIAMPAQALESGEAATIAGEASVDSESDSNQRDYSRRLHPQDPWESFNRPIYRFNNFLDTYLLRPTAVGYRKVTPEVVDRSITNFFHNVGDVVTLANSVLQLKHRRAAETTTRLMFNTIFGVAGLFDVATGWGLPRRPEDFGQTLVYWGAPEGNYLMLPILGPATVTDAIGAVPDGLISPLNWLGEPDVYFANLVNVVDQRADVIPGEHLIVGDEYIFIRNAYLQQRNYLNNDGQVDSDPFLDDDF